MTFINLILVMMTLVLSLVSSLFILVMRCLFYPWPLTPYCCGGVRFISASSLFIFLSWGACFIFGPWHCIPVVTLVLFLVSNLFILLSWGACFISGLWHQVIVVAFVLSLPPAYLFFWHEMLALSMVFNVGNLSKIS